MISSFPFCSDLALRFTEVFAVTEGTTLTAPLFGLDADNDDSAGSL